MSLNPELCMNILRQFLGSRSVLRAVKIRCAPVEASSSAMARPIPELAPVTTAHFPLHISGSLLAFSIFAFLHGLRC